MKDFILEKMLEKLGVPEEVKRIFNSGKKYVVPKSRDELIELSMGGKEDIYEVNYDIPGEGIVKEAWATKVKNGVVVNYTDSYMRRREPDCLFIADDKPTDKQRFSDKFGYDFKIIKNATFDWLEQQDLIIMPFMSGDDKYGYQSLYIGPLNSAFFAWALADMQSFIPADKIPENYNPKAILYLAPTFRKTHFDGKQVVVHNRLDEIHEVFAYNLYPGPSAKKGIYGVLLNQGEKEGWTTLHASTVKVLVPHKSIVTILHEGASGSGKTEMAQHVGGDVSGRITFGENVVTGQKYRMKFHSICKIRPVTDDMAMAHPDMQKGNGKLVVRDAEDAWFIRTDNIEMCGTDPELERLCVHSPEPVLFLNFEAVPKTSALIWEPILEPNGKKCTNPRVVMPKRNFPRVVDSTVSVDIRSFGVRTPPCTRENPTYGIIGMFHMLPPSVAWLWRLVAPRGYSNPSIIDTNKGMSSEGVGSYWPFATGKKVDQANILLGQIQNSYNVKYILTPNQHIGAWKVGFMPQWLAREFLVLYGNHPIFRNMLKPVQNPLLGYVLKNIELPDVMVPREFVEVNLQPEVGEEAYQKGSQILNEFFRKELEQYLTPELDPMGRKIIECFMDGGETEDYERFIITDQNKNEY